MKEFFSDKKHIIIVAAAVIVILAIIIAVICVSCGKEDVVEDTTKSDSETPVSTAINPLTGESGFNEDYVGVRPIAITIQNSESICRPQWGLSAADIVIEGEVEGCGTKYLWLISDWTKAEKCGPFRSVRRDFVELAEGFDAILVHCGWSSGTSIGAAEYLNSTGYDHAGSCAEWGDVSPSGVSGCGQEYKSYTNYDLISANVESSSMRTETSDSYLHPFTFYDKATAVGSDKCSSISFKIGTNYATFTWKDGAYYGDYSGTAIKDNDGTLYSVANVVVLYLNSIDVVDSKGRVDMDLSSGTGILASNGTYKEITWTKGDGADMIKLYDEDGKTEVKLNVGKTYIALARLDNASATEIEA